MQVMKRVGSGSAIRHQLMQIILQKQDCNAKQCNKNSSNFKGFIR